MAQGSLSELDTQLDLAVLLGYLDKEKLEEIADPLLRTDKMLTGLIRKLTEKTK